jgi:hypothetical protein
MSDDLFEFLVVHEMGARCLGSEACYREAYSSNAAKSPAPAYARLRPAALRSDEAALKVLFSGIRDRRSSPAATIERRAPIEGLAVVFGDHCFKSSIDHLQIAGSKASSGRRVPGRGAGRKLEDARGRKIAYCNLAGRTVKSCAFEFCASSLNTKGGDRN